MFIAAKFRNRKGTSLMELALLLPLLLMLIFGGLEFALLMYNQQVLTNASREGARMGIVQVFDPDNPGNNRVTNTEIVEHVADYTEDHMVTFGEENDPVTHVQREGPDFQDNLNIRVTYNYEFLYLDNFGFGPIELEAETVMKNE